MRPSDLIELNRQYYLKSSKMWMSENFSTEGLLKSEKELLAHMDLPQGSRILLMGLGGGREAFPLAEMGFSIGA